MDTLPLFDEPSDFDRERLRSKLAALASEGIYIGTSSWKYEGWIGQIYSRNRYLTRGRFSEKRFQAECLNEYAETFPIVCGDFSFYQFPSEIYWQRLFQSAPASLQYAFKVPEEVTVKAFPTHPRYGARAGENNSSFLDAALFQNAFLDLLQPYRQRIAVLILEFGFFPKHSYRSVSEFLGELDPFLAALPPDFRYAIEIRNPEFLDREYFACLHQHGAAHVFNAWTRMPELSVQTQLPDAHTAGFTVARALLRHGRPYEQAVAQFSPYQSVQDPNPAVRQALRDLIARARKRHEPSYIFVNNRLEGNAPQTIEAIADRRRHEVQTSLVALYLTCCMRLRFWGTRGSIATPGPGSNHFGGNTSCIELTTPAGVCMVLDCGTGARLLGNKIMANANGPVDATILLTHTHWDHIQGFPFFAPLFVPGNHFHVYGPEGAHLSLRDVLAGQMEHHYFPVDLDQLSARISYQDLSEGTHLIAGVNVTAQQMNHPSPTLGYRIQAEGACVCYLSDHEPFYEGVWRDGAKPGLIESILDPGDRRHAEYMHGADIVIHEAQYTPEEYPAKRHWGHSTYSYVVELAAAAGVRRLFLTHHDPSHDDAFMEVVEQRARDMVKQLGVTLDVTAAYEGLEVNV